MKVLATITPNRKIWGRSSQLLTDSTDESESGRTDGAREVRGFGGEVQQRSRLTVSYCTCWFITAPFPPGRLGGCCSNLLYSGIRSPLRVSLTGCLSVCLYSLDLYCDFPETFRRPGTRPHIYSDRSVTRRYGFGDFTAACS